LSSLSPSTGFHAALAGWPRESKAMKDGRKDREEEKRSSKIEGGSSSQKF
jgi:hypothetical protein